MPFVKKTKSKSFQTITKQNKNFIGRTAELLFFVENILQPEDPTHNIISISGQGGVGKTTLLTQLIDKARSSNFKEYCLTALVNERQVTPASIMEEFANQFHKLGYPLKRFEEALVSYKESLRKLQAEQGKTGNDILFKAAPEVVGSVAKNVPIVGGVLEEVTKATAEYMVDRLRYRQLLADAERLEDPIGTLTNAFIHDLNHLLSTQIMSDIKRERRLILFFDTFEKLATEIAPWLLDYFLMADINSNIVLVIAGRDPIERSTPNNRKSWLPYLDAENIYSISLNSFKKSETQEYLALRGIAEPDRVATIWQLSQGLPLYLSLLTSDPQGKVDPTADVVDNFLHWIPEQEPDKRKLALDASLLSRPFNKDELDAFTYIPESDRSTYYYWLTEQPFVLSNPQDGRHQYHDLAQKIFSRHLYQYSTKDYRDTRTALVNYYRSQLEKIQKESGEKVKRTTKRLELVFALTYQLFSLSDEPSILEAIEQILSAYGSDISKLQEAEIVRFLHELSQENQNSHISRDARKIAKMLRIYIEANQENQEFLSAASFLLEKVKDATSFSKEQLARIYSSRGESNRLRREYAKAIEDFDRAIQLKSNFAWAIFSRGQTFSSMRDYKKALKDIDRAIKLDPGHKHTGEEEKGLIFRALREYQKGIDAHIAALIANPFCTTCWKSLIDTYLILYSRDEIYKLIQAVSIPSFDPVSVTIYRANALREKKFVDEALIDLTEAIESRPNDLWALLCRARAYNNLQQYEEALADINRALQIIPNDNVHIGERGRIYERMQNYEKALEDYNLAIRLDSRDAWALLRRGIIYILMGSYKNALTDLERAIKLDSDFEHEGQKGRGLALLSLGKRKAAVEAFTRAIIAHPLCEECWAEWTKTTETLGDTDYDKKALINFNQAIKLHPEATEPFIARGKLYQLMGYYEEALTDFDQAIAFDETKSPDLDNDRGLLLSYLGQYAEAIEIYKHGLKKNPTSYVLAYNIAVVMLVWKGLPEAQSYLDAAYNLLQKIENIAKDAAVLYGFGGLEALTGDSEKALDYLAQAIESEESVRQWARRDIAWHKLRSNPYFQSLIV